MKYYWTRYGFKYPQTIVYMLQASEYNLKDYFSWLHRTDDFRSVVKRRQLHYTKKAVLLLGIVWLMLIVLYATALILFLFSLYLSEFLFILPAFLLFVLSPIIVAYGISIPLLVGQKLVQEPKQRQIISAASKILVRHPALKIAVAGSYGKTTAKEVLSTIIGEGKKVARTPGNMNTPLGIARFTTALKGDEDIIIFELGEERVGDIKTLCELVRPDIGIITGINEAHLSSFKTLDRTVATIFELSDYLGDKPLYKNKESELVAAKLKKGDKLAYDCAGVNGWKISNVTTSIQGTSFTTRKDDRIITARTKLIGAYNIGIIAAVIDIADSVGLSVAQIKSGIEKTVPFEHRMQPRNFHGAWIIDDTYNGNSQGMRVGLDLLKTLPAKRRIYVTPGLVGLGDKTKQIHQVVGSQIAESADVVVLMKNSVTDYILEGLKTGNFKGKTILIDDPLEFYNNLDSFVAGGDIVLMQNDWTDNYA